MIRNISLLMVIFFILAFTAGCTSPTDSAPQEIAQSNGPKTYQTLVVGFSQIGAESEWRTANTASIQETAEDLGVELIFSDAQQKQENQIKAIRSFIAQGEMPL